MLPGVVVDCMAADFKPKHQPFPTPAAASEPHSNCRVWTKAEQCMEGPYHSFPLYLVCLSMCTASSLVNVCTSSVHTPLSFDWNVSL